MFILSCCYLTFHPYALKWYELIPKTYSAWSNTTLIIFASPAKPLKYFLCCISKESIKILNVKWWPSCFSDFTWVLNSTLVKFVTIWQLFSSNNLIWCDDISLLLHHMLSAMPFLHTKHSWKHSGRIKCSSHFGNSNCH